MIIQYQGLKIQLNRNVYPPSDDTYLLAENLLVEPGDLVLEIGTGTGLISLIAAKTAQKVIATDVTPEAITLALHNIHLNQMGHKIELRQGDLFTPILQGEKFDLILFNPPYLPIDRTQMNSLPAPLTRAWNGGITGRFYIDPFIEECRNFLNKGGRVQLIQSSLSDIKKSCQLFQINGFEVKIHASIPSFFERIVLLNANLIY
ncbi:MAG: HemK2/MTQ2 family protein methyltransferase [Candidatus Helarchaeota archaeon]